jgi:hypothetical protein
MRWYFLSGLFWSCISPIRVCVFVSKQRWCPPIRACVFASKQRWSFLWGPFCVRFYPLFNFGADRIGITPPPLQFLYCFMRIRFHGNILWRARCGSTFNIRGTLHGNVQARNNIRTVFSLRSA